MTRLRQQAGRICDEVVVDLMIMACGVSYEEAEGEIQIFTIDGEPIPFASPKLLLRAKQTHRDKDAEDRFFLERKIAGLEQCLSALSPQSNYGQ